MLRSKYGEYIATVGRIYPMRSAGTSVLAYEVRTRRLSAAWYFEGGREM